MDCDPRVLIDWSQAAAVLEHFDLDQDGFLSKAEVRPVHAQSTLRTKRVEKKQRSTL